MHLALHVRLTYVDSNYPSSGQGSNNDSRSATPGSPQADQSSLGAAGPFSQHERAGSHTPLSSNPCRHQYDGDERDDGEGAYGDGREATEKSDVETDLDDFFKGLRKAVQDHYGLLMSVIVLGWSVCGRIGYQVLV